MPQSVQNSFKNLLIYNVDMAIGKKYEDPMLDRFRGIFFWLNFFQQIAALGLLLESSPFYSVLSNLPEPEPTAPTSTITFAVQQAIYDSLPTLEDLVDLNETEE